MLSTATTPSVLPLHLPSPASTGRAALDHLRADLLGMPAEAVDVPIAPVADLIRAAEDFARASRSARELPETAIERIALLASALREAQLRHLFLPLPPDADPGLSAYVDRSLCRLETGVAELVDQGVIDADTVPRAASGEAARCARGIALVELLRARKRTVPRVRLGHLVTACRTLLPWLVQTPAQLAISNLRDRAYSALRAELAAAQVREPTSGVHTLDLAGLDEPVRAAA